MTVQENPSNPSRKSHRKETTSDVCRIRIVWWKADRVGSPSSPSFEGSNEIRRGDADYRQVFGLAGSVLFLLTVASQFTVGEPVLVDGGRSCLPLRDSSGFSPDSLLGLIARVSLVRAPRPSVVERRLA